MTTEILQKERKKGWKWTPEMRARQCVVRQKIGRPAWPPDATARFKLLMKNRVSPRKGAKLTDDTKRKISISKTGHKMTDIQKQHYSTAGKKRWQNKEYARKILSVASPNKQEVQLQEMLNEVFPKLFVFVGDGQLRIGTKYPDFVHTSQHKLIELYGDYYHSKDEEIPRIEYFKQFGYDCIIIWASELKNIELVKTKVCSLLHV